MRSVFALFAVFVASGCSSSSPLPAADALIKLERGGCGYIGACPAYAISVKPDGRYHYEGIRNVPILGVREGRLPAGSWERAELAFTQAGWTDLGDPTTREGGYPCMSDSPFARITRKVKTGEEKVFSYNLGCDSKRGSALLSALNEILPIPAS